jgi:hypothetical protein
VRIGCSAAHADRGDGTPGTPDRRPTVVSFVGRPFLNRFDLIDPPARG